MPDKTFSLQLTKEEIATILNSVGRKPYFEVSGLMQKIAMQVDAQNQSPPKNPSKGRTAPGPNSG